MLVLKKAEHGHPKGGTQLPTWRVHSSASHPSGWQPSSSSLIIIRTDWERRGDPICFPVSNWRNYQVVYLTVVYLTRQKVDSANLSDIETAPLTNRQRFLHTKSNTGTANHSSVTQE